MKKTLFIVFMCAVSALSVDSLKIYDKGYIKTKIYNNEKFTEPVHSKFIEPVGNPKENSKLMYSTVKIIDCDKSYERIILYRFNERINSSVREANWYGVALADSLSLKTCITLRNHNELYKYLEFDLFQSGKTKIKEKLIWVGKLGDDEVKNIYLDISNSSKGESVKELSLEYILDLDNDDMHELVIEKRGYAGKSMAIIHFFGKKYLVKNILADYWD